MTTGEGRDRDAPRLLSVSAAARLLGVSPSSLRAWAAAGQVPHVRTPGGHRRFEVDRLVEWLGERGGSPPAPAARRSELVPTRVEAAPSVAGALRNEVEDILDAFGDQLRAGRASARVSGSRAARLRETLETLADGLDSGDLGRSYRDAEWEGFRQGAAGQPGDAAVIEALSLRAAVDRVIGPAFPADDPGRRSLERAVDRMAVRVAAGYADGVRCRLRSALEA
jgi:excisionase family DNA binding protein